MNRYYFHNEKTFVEQSFSEAKTVAEADQAAVDAQPKIQADCVKILRAQDSTVIWQAK